MRSAPPEQIRNLGFVAHINAGKTTLTERILFDSGKQKHLGAVDEGTATMDFLPEEQRRGISIRAALATVPWRGSVLNLVDTPGHVDFAAEVERTLRVVDGVVVLVDGVRGVESQTEMVWRQAQRARLPALVFVNKLDRPAADWRASLQSLRDRLGLRVLPVVVPLCDAQGQSGLVEVVERRTSEWRPGGTPAADVEAARLALVEAAAEVDAGVLESFALDQPIDAGALRAALRAATAQRRVVLAYAGSALRDHGVADLLDGICAFLPSPADTGPVAGVDGAVRQPDPAAPFCGFVVRTLADADGPFALVRIYAGEIRPGDRIAATECGEPLVVGSVSHIHADLREPIESGAAGDIVALDGLDGIAAGATVFAPGQAIRLEPPRFPAPVVTAAIEPRHVEDRAAVAEGLRALVAEDPTLAERHDAERDVLLLAGMGELHLEVAAERLRSRVGDRFRVGKPDVALRATLAGSARAQAEWRRPDAGASAAIELHLAPAPGTGAPEVAAPRGLGAPPEVVESVRVGLAAELASGAWTPWPLVDAELRIERLELVGAATDEAVALALEAARVALRRALASAGVVMLEPVVRFEVDCPGETLSAVLGDLRGKGAEIEAIDASGPRTRTTGVVPLARMLGYSTRLRSLTRGLGSFFLEPAGHRPAARAGGE